MDFLYMWVGGVAAILWIAFFVVLWHQWQYAVSQAERWQTRWVVADERVNTALAENRRLQKELKDACDRVDRAIEQRNRATDALNEWLKKADELKQELAEKIKQQEATDKVVTAYQEENAELKHALDGWKDSVQMWKDAASDNSRLNDVLKLQATQLKQQMAELSRRKDECQQQKADLEVELQRVSEESSRWVVEYGKATAVIATQEQKITELRAQLDERVDVALNRDRMMRTQLDEALDRLDRAIEQQEATDKVVTKVVTAYQEENAELKAQLEDRDREISELRKLSPRYTDLTKQVDELGQQLQSKEGTILNLERQLKEKDRRVTALDAMVENQVGTIRTMQRDLSENEKQILQMYSDAKELKKQLDEKSNRIKELTVAQAPAPNQPTFITTDQCDEIRKGDRQYIDELKAAIQEMGQTIRNKDKEIAHLESSLLPHMGSMHRADVDTMVAAHKKKVDDLIRSMAQKQKTIEEMDRMSKQNHHQIKSLVGLRDNLREQIKQKDARITELEQRIMQMEKESASFEALLQACRDGVKKDDLMYADKRIERQNKQLVEAHRLVLLLKGVLESEIISAVKPVYDGEAKTDVP